MKKCDIDNCASNAIFKLNWSYSGILFKDWECRLFCRKHTKKFMSNILDKELWDKFTIKRIRN